MTATPKNTARRRAMLLGVILASAAPSTTALAASFPERPISMTVPYGAGNPSDIVARLLAQSLGRRLGQPVVVENKPGAGTVVGTMHVLQKPADGHNLLFTTSALVTAPYLVANLPFSPTQDLAPIAFVAGYTINFSLNKDVPVSNLPEFVNYAKQNPGKLNVAVSGVASPGNLVMALFNQHFGLTMTHVYYDSNVKASADLLAGHVQLFVDNMIGAAPHLKTKNLKSLGTATRTRSPFTPDIPTIAEQGFPGFAYEPWIAIFGPRGLPPDVVARLNKEINEVLKEPAVRERLDSLFLSTEPAPAEQLGQRVKDDLVFWKKAADAAGVKPQ